MPKPDLRIDETEHGEIERTRQRREGAAQHIGVELVAAGRDAERARGALAVLDGAQVEAHAADAIRQVTPSTHASTARKM